MILKLFYSGKNDIIWLNRDFGIKTNSYFDVQTCALNVEKKNSNNSLLALIEKYCGLNINK